MRRREHSHRPSGGAAKRLAWSGALLGVASLLWLLIRSGRRPSRLAYPCQRAALGHVSLLFGVPLAHFLHRSLAGRVARRFGRAGSIALSAARAGGVALGGLSDTAPALSAARPALAPRDGYTATVYVVENAGGPSGDHHAGVDDLVACLAAGGVKLYRSATVGAESGPDGIVGADDVVLVKVNAQWSQRGGTNTDVLKGLIARVLEHPDGFAGEVVVCENTQGVGTLDWSQANAEDTGQSALDVVNHFAAMGKPVSAYAWDTIRTRSVTEYDEGSLTDGYVVGPYLADVLSRVSYPKFRTDGGSYVSLARGIWDPSSETYDDTRLKLLNVPVLKCHGAVYGVTACVKHHMGTVTTSLQTNAHGAVRWGALGKVLAQVRMADLNVLDCIWVLARPSYGPSCSYAQATRLDALVAGTDPVAVDLWATKNLLVPAIVANGYSSYPMQDPDDPGSIFRTYLDASAAQLLAAGIDVTNDPAHITALRWSAVTAEPPAAGEPARVGAFPNPFAETTTIRPGTAEAGPLRVYDVTGRLVRTLAPAGADGRVTWDGRDDAGRVLPAGTYYLRGESPRGPVCGKVTRLR